MVLYTQLVCSTCRKILTFPIGSISCRCRNCTTINPIQQMEIVCETCDTTLLFPINTLLGMCPCCATEIEIPKELLPEVEEPVNLDTRDDDAEAVPMKTVYVQNPPTMVNNKSVQSVCIGTKIV